MVFLQGYSGEEVLVGDILSRDGHDHGDSTIAKFTSSTGEWTSPLAVYVHHKQ